jgi:hypothetical protein
MSAVRTIVVAAAFASAAALSPSSAVARGGPVHAGGGWHGGGSLHGAWRGGGHYRGGPSYRGGHWAHRGYGRGVFWGGVGLGLGIGTIGYWRSYDPWYVAPGWGTVVYDAPLVAAPIYESPPLRAAQPVPQVAHAPDPIFYPKNGQTPEATENDRRDCNRWATTQPGAMADASIFQRATLACMEGRGYSVR